MKIRELHIDRFGCFRGHTRAFDPGFVPIAGCNESGKTTLLEFIRRLFFGFPDRRSSGNLYLPIDDERTPDFGGGATLELDNGDVIRIERHRCNGKLRLTAADGGVSEAADEEFLRLTGISGELYGSLYAITVDELTSLARLKDDEIRNRLYGAPLAAPGVSLSGLGKGFQDEENALFRPRSANTEYARLRAEHDTVAAELRTLEANLPRAEEARRRAETFDREAQDADARRKHFAAEVRRAEEELKLLTLLRETEAAAARFNRLPPLPEVPGDWQSLRAQRRDAIRRAEAECAAIHVDAEPPLPEVPGDWQSRRDALLDALRRAETECAADPDPRPDAPEIDESVLLRADELLKDSIAAARPEPPPFAALALLAVAIAAATAALLLPLLLLLLAAAAAIAAAAWLFLRRNRRHARRQAESAAAVDGFRRRYGLAAADPAGFAAELRAAQSARVRRLAIAEAHRAARETARRALAEFDASLGVDGDAGFAALLARRDRFLRARAEAENSRAALETARRALAEFDASLGVDGDAGFTALLVRRDEFLRVRAEAENSRAALERLAGGAERISALRERFAGAGEEELRREIEKHRADEAECDRLRQQAIRNAEAARQDARRLGEGDPAALATRLDGIRGEIRETLRRLLTVHGARALLGLAVARYERDSQPEVIRRAAANFAAFTGGRYTRCFRSAGSGELTVTDSVTKLDKTFEHLSRGTREQLMLAMRLALIEAREAGGAESMPVILDDIGVNFDPERRKAVLDRLREFAAGRQLLFFSHEG